MAVQGAQEAMAGGPLWPWPRSPRPGYYSRNPSTPPQKKSMGQLRGIRSPPGLNKQEQDSPQEQGTGRPSWAKLGSWGFLWAWWGIRGPHRVPQQPLPLPRQERQVAGNGLRGHNQRSRLPPTSLHGQTRQDGLKLFLWARQDLKSKTLGTWHGTPGRDVDWIHGTWGQQRPAGLLGWAADSSVDFPMDGELERAAAGRLDIGTAGGLQSAAAGGLGWAADGGLEGAAARVLDLGAADGGGEFPANGGLEGAADSGVDIPADGGWLEGLAASGLAEIPPNSYAKK